MQETNRLSDNLKAIQRDRGCNLAEFSVQLGVPKSTLQSVLRDGNTTLETLMRIQQALGISLDELVYGDASSPSKDQVQAMVQCISVYSELPPQKQEQFRFYAGKLMEVFKKD